MRQNIQSVNDSWNVTQDGQQDVDEEVGIASALEEDTERWQHDGEDDLDDVACGERHGGRGGVVVCVGDLSSFVAVVWICGLEM